jgi:hypothetical protein
MWQGVASVALLRDAERVAAARVSPLTVEVRWSSGLSLGYRIAWA